MPQALTKQELHNLAMNIVGEDMKSQGFEFLGVNSKIGKDPQFVGLKNKDLHFVIVALVIIQMMPIPTTLYLCKQKKNTPMVLRPKHIMQALVLGMVLTMQNQF